MRQLWRTLRNMLRGAASVLDIWPPRRYYTLGRAVERSDGDALRSDWERVGKHLQNACGGKNPPALVDERPDPPSNSMEGTVLRDLDMIRLEPGDKVILRPKCRLSEEAKRTLNATWRKIFESYDITAVVLEHDMDIAVLRRGDESKPAEDA